MSAYKYSNMNQINQRIASPLQNGIILFLMLFFTNFWSFKAYSGIPRYVLFFVTYLLLFILLRDRKYLQGKTMAGNVNFIITSFFLSCIPSIFIFGQNLYAALAGILMVLSPILLYYLLHKWNISENKLYKYLIIFTAVFAFFSIFQQFTYPTYWFGGREESEYTGSLEERMGFWRFYLFGKDFCALALMLCFGKILRKRGKNILNYIPFIVCVAAIYFFLARKEIYGAISCIALGYLFSAKNTGFATKIIMAVLAVAGYSLLSSTMVELNMQTSQELGEGSDDFIRILAAQYFMYDFSNSPLYYVLGSGIPGGENMLSKTITYLTENMHFYQDDCGFIGYFSRFGIIGLAIQIFVVIKIIRNYKYIDLTLLLYGVWQLEECFFDFWCTNTRHAAAFAIYLYLIDKSIERNRSLRNNVLLS